eukprot:IDg12614t1
MLSVTCAVRTGSAGRPLKSLTISKRILKTMLDTCPGTNDTDDTLRDKCTGISQQFLLNATKVQLICSVLSICAPAVDKKAV